MDTFHQAGDFSLIGWGKFKKTCRAIRPHLTKKEFQAVSKLLAEMRIEDEKNSSNPNDV